VSVDAAQERLRELSDFAAPWAVWIAATLRLADHVQAGATRPEDLAERVGADPDALQRLLRYLVARGVFAEEGGAYANSDVSALLLDEAAGGRGSISTTRPESGRNRGRGYSGRCARVRRAATRAGTTRNSYEPGAPRRSTH
jgi:hypothetical protein